MSFKQIPAREDWPLYSFEHQAKWLRAENERLRQRLLAHHEMSNLSEQAIFDAYVGEGTGKCPVCRNVDEGR